jgi:hypothetical protein
MMACPRISTAVALLLCVVSVVTVRTQTIERTEAQSIRDDAERIPIGATVKLRLRSGERLKGVLFSSDESSIRVKPVTRRPEPTRRIPYDGIETIQRYQDHVSLGKYAGVGAAIGGGVILTLLGIAAHAY